MAWRHAAMTTADLGRVDVLVIGAGNAAANAALPAREQGASVVMLETAPNEARGGNSHFTGGAFRFTFSTSRTSLALPPTSPTSTSPTSISAATRPSSTTTTCIG